MPAPNRAGVAGSQASLESRLASARQLRANGSPREAEPMLVELLESGAPESVQQPALLELAMAAQDENELPRAQQIYAQFLSRWPNAALMPDVLLRLGRLFRQMGLNNLALAKFYAVMTSSLVLKNDAFDYYQRLVLLAQTEIAETHYQQGRYAEAVDFFGRLLKQNNPALNRALTQFKLLRALSALGRDDETVAQGQDFLDHFSDTPECAEARFYLALALKRLGRNNEALQQVLTLLKQQQQRKAEHPELWAYWQQRAGNEIGNQLYREGDYTKALGIYLSVAQLDTRPDWQLPVNYQIGLTYERLAQPEKAFESYQSVLKREGEVGTNAAPGLKAVVEMARWRSGYVQWETKAGSLNHTNFSAPSLRASASTAKPTDSKTAVP